MTERNGIVSLTSKTKETEMLDTMEQLALQTAKVVRNSLMTYAPGTEGLDQLQVLIVTADTEKELCNTSIISPVLDSESASPSSPAGELTRTPVVTEDRDQSIDVDPPKAVSAESQAVYGSMAEQAQAEAKKRNLLNADNVGSSDDETIG